MHLRVLFVLVLVDPYAGSTPSGRAFANYWNRENVCEDSLLASSVAAGTAHAYMRAVSEFLDWARAESSDDRSFRSKGLDRMLSHYFSYLCFSAESEVQRAHNSLYGVLYLMPQLKGGFPRAIRSISAFSELRPPGERGPWDRDGIGAVCVQFLLLGRAQCGLITLFAFATMARAQDWRRLRISDLSFSKPDEEPRAGMIFGNHARGERTKTGFNQGFDLGPEWAFLILWLRVHVDALRARHGDRDVRVFSISDAAFRTAWKAVARQLGLPEDPPHVLRHSGASFRVAVLQHPLAEVQRDGRWRALSSVRRYTKTWLLQRFRSRANAASLARGAQFWANPGRFLEAALAD